MFFQTYNDNPLLHSMTNIMLQTKDEFIFTADASYNKHLESSMKRKLVNVRALSRTYSWKEKYDSLLHSTIHSESLNYVFLPILVRNPIGVKIEHMSGEDLVEMLKLISSLTVTQDIVEVKARYGRLMIPLLRTNVTSHILRSLIQRFILLADREISTLLAYHSNESISFSNLELLLRLNIRSSSSFIQRIYTFFSNSHRRAQSDNFNPINADLPVISLQQSILIFFSILKHAPVDIMQERRSAFSYFFSYLIFSSSFLDKDLVSNHILVFVIGFKKLLAEYRYLRKIIDIEMQKKSAQSTNPSLFRLLPVEILMRLAEKDIDYKRYLFQLSIIQDIKDRLRMRIIDIIKGKNLYLNQHSSNPIFNAFRTDSIIVTSNNLINNYYSLSSFNYICYNHLENQRNRLAHLYRALDYLSKTNEYAYAYNI